MVNVPLVVYTHSDCFDVFDLFMKQEKKHSNFSKKYVFTNSLVSECDYTQILYGNDTYRLRLISCLEKIDDKFILFCHEDMILYGDVDENKLNSFIENMEYDSISNKIETMLGHAYVTSKISSIKLSRSDNDHGDVMLSPELAKIDNKSSNKFSLQPTLWNRVELLKILNNIEANNIWELEVNANKYLETIVKYTNCFYLSKGIKRKNSGHYDSTIYPYIATAIVKGKWNFLQYPDELNAIFKNNDYKNTREFYL